MKKLSIFVASLALLAASALADPVEGLWKTKPGESGDYGYVQISTCGSNICGTLTKAFDSAGNEISSDAVGKRMIWDMQAKGDGNYSGGKIWAPDADKTYASKMSLSGNTLKVSGCVAGGVICRGQNWTRIQ